MTISAKITSKGQITLPKKLRDELGLKPGDVVSFEKKNDGNYAIETAEKVPQQSLESLFGMIKTDIRLSLHDIDDAIGEAAATNALDKRH